MGPRKDNRYQSKQNGATCKSRQKILVCRNRSVSHNIENLHQEIMFYQYRPFEPIEIASVFSVSGHRKSTVPSCRHRLLYETLPVPNFPPHRTSCPKRRPYCECQDYLLAWQLKRYGFQFIADVLNGSIQLLDLRL